MPSVSTEIFEAMRLLVFLLEPPSFINKAEILPKIKNMLSLNFFIKESGTSIYCLFLLFFNIKINIITFQTEKLTTLIQTCILCINKNRCKILWCSRFRFL